MYTKQALVDILRNTEGKIFRVSFIKRTTGELRHLNGRFGVRKGVKGVGMKYDPISKGLLPVYDIQKKEFRLINISGIREVEFQGTVYKTEEV